jgi:stage V sporulation protein T
LKIRIISLCYVSGTSLTRCFQQNPVHPNEKNASVSIHNSPFPANTSTGENRASRASKEKRIMKATGIVRRVDDLGRIVIPKEIRRTLRIREGDPLLTSLTRWEKYCFSMLDLAKRRGW